MPNGDATGTFRIPGLYITVISSSNQYYDNIPTPDGGTQIYSNGDLQVPDGAESGIEFVGNYMDKTVGLAMKFFGGKGYIKVLSNNKVKIEFYEKVAKNCTVSFELQFEFRPDQFGPPTDH